MLAENIYGKVEPAPAGSADGVMRVRLTSLADDARSLLLRHLVQPGDDLEIWFASR
jgi:hypothetical protein